MGRDTEDELDLVSKKATRDLAELLALHKVKVQPIIYDWKQTMPFVKEISEEIQEHPGWIPFIFADGHMFEDGCGDDLICLLFSGRVDPEVPERVANLIYNLGADVPEDEPGDSLPPRLCNCPSCGNILNETSNVEAKESILKQFYCPGCDLKWESKVVVGFEDKFLTINLVL